MIIHPSKNNLNKEREPTQPLSFWQLEDALHKGRANTDVTARAHPPLTRNGFEEK